MATNAQTLANQANAQASTGPRTADGKQTSAQNAQTHGLAVSDNTLRREESTRYTKLLAELTDRYQPQDTIRETLVSELALATLRLRRCQALEAQLTDEAADLLAEFPRLDKIDRYRHRAQRLIFQLQQELTTTPAMAAAALLPQLPPPPPEFFAAVKKTFEAAAAAHVTQHRSDNKPGRNEPCHCGSGRKFKHCCLHQPAAPLQQLAA